MISQVRMHPASCIGLAALVCFLWAAGGVGWGVWGYLEAAEATMARRAERTYELCAT